MGTTGGAGSAHEAGDGGGSPDGDPASVQRAIDGLFAAIVLTARDDRSELDRLDGVTGDGDFGATLARGARALLADRVADDAPADRLRAAGTAMTAAMGGTSGPLWGVAMLRAGGALEGVAALDPATAGRAVRAALEGIQEYGGAQVGDKTLIDALVPVADALDAGGGLAEAAQAAQAGAEGTAGMTARLGRASYAGDHAAGEPDAGATGIAAILRRLAEGPAEDLDALRSGGALRSAAADDDPPEQPGFADDPAELVADSIDGLVAARPDLLRRLEDQPVVLRADAPVDGQVALVSGGGAGHEPMHAGLVGPGMLAAACPGAVFTSPTPDAVHAATRAVDAGAGVLHVVKNYTGDVLNFRLAAELAAEAGVEVRAVVVADDVAIDAGAATGRRGTGVTIAVERLAGALAATGAGLDEVTALAERVAGAGRSYGVALHEAEGEIELGVGIHGEPGRERRPHARMGEIAGAMVDAVAAELEGAGRSLVLLSGLGGTPQLELFALYGRIEARLRDRGIEPVRTLVGDLITSLDQPGAVLSVVPLDPELEELWDAPLRTAALQWG